MEGGKCKSVLLRGLAPSRQPLELSGPTHPFFSPSPFPSSSLFLLVLRCSLGFVGLSDIYCVCGGDRETMEGGMVRAV
jgi:hypothetical protein